MKMKFSGWRRQVYPHRHEVSPVQKYGNVYRPAPGRRSLLWSDDGLTAYGKVHGVALSGDFLVEFTFTEAELKNWIRSRFKADPAGAARLLSDLMVEAIGNLAISAPRNDCE